MVDPLAWQAPVANAAKMPAGWTDAAGLCLVAMGERLGAPLPALVLASTRKLGMGEEVEMGWTPGATGKLAKLDPVFCLQALYAYWCACLDDGVTPVELELDPKVALAAVSKDPVLGVVYTRTLAIAELPHEELPTFSSVMGAIRDDFRAIFGRDVRVDAPNPPSSSSPFKLAAVGLAAYYLWRVTA